MLLFNKQGFTASYTDYLLENGAAQQNFVNGKVGNHFVARVIDFYPYYNSYLIQSGGMPPMLAVTVSGGSGIPVGNRMSENICVGSLVFCYTRGDLGSTAFILGTIPEQIVKTEIKPDAFIRAGNTGFAAESSITYLKDQAGLRNFNSCKPVDTFSTDWVVNNELGLGIFMGNALLSLRGTDLSRIDLFYIDNLIRIHGHNLEVFTAGEERKAYNDNGEYTDIKRGSPYPWEMLGVTNYENSATVDNKDISVTDADLSKDSVSPKESNQTLIARWLEFKGYLGDLEKRIVAIPNKFKDPETTSSDNKYFGVLDITTGLDGRYSIKSAKGIHLHKTIHIPVPKQVLDEADPSGDTKENYKFAGVAGKGPDHKKPEFEFNESVSLAPAQLRDFYSYTFNYYDKLSFIKHAKDWKLPEDKDILSNLEAESFGVKLNKLSYFIYPLPKFLNIKIDHRTTGKYYLSQSAIDLLDNGSVVITGAHGEQLILANGNITITAPGDVFTRPGRSSITWAPGDIVQRAGASIDLTTSKNDIRLKAQKNLHMLSSEAGVLIESRGNAALNFEGVGEDVTSNGVIIKAATDIVQHSKNNYTNTTGAIIISANNGNSPIYTLASQSVNLCKGQFSIFAGIDPGQETPAANVAVHTFGITNSLISTGCVFGGTVASIPLRGGSSGFQAIGNIFLDNGSFITTKTGDGEKYVHTGATYNDGITLNEYTSTVLKDVETSVETVHTGFEQTYITSNTGILNSTYITKIGFSLRNENQYNTDVQTLIVETDWQQRYRANNITTTWNEPVVTAPNGTITAPHPGNDVWNNFSCFVTVNNKFIDNAVNDTYKNRADYVDNTGAEPVSTVLNKNYITTE